MIKPTIGRIVWFYREWMRHTDDPYAAIITKVWGDDMVNLAGFDWSGRHFNVTSVLLVQGEGCYGNPSGGPWCMWMPYQKGQAAKTEELEKTIFETAAAARAAGREVKD